MLTPLSADHASTIASPLTAVRVCVTGGAGFIGSHLVDALAALGAEVTVLDDLSQGREVNLAAARSRVRILTGSILDDSMLDAAMIGTRVVFHLAALASVPASVDNPRRFQAVNSDGTVRVLEAARRHGVERVIYAASSSAYGDTTTLPQRETMPPDPRSPYAMTKLSGEHAMRAWALCYGLQTLSLRYFNVFGPRQRHDSAYAAVIPRWISAVRRGEPVEIFGDGRQTRDFVFVANAVHANLCAATSTARLEGQAVNIGSGERRSLLSLLEAIERTIGRRVERRMLPARAGDVRESEADIRAARSLIGYEPIVAFHDGLRLTIEAEAAAPAAALPNCGEARV